MKARRSSPPPSDSQHPNRRSVLQRAARLTYEAPLLLGAIKLSQEKSFALSGGRKKAAKKAVKKAAKKAAS